MNSNPIVKNFKQVKQRSTVSTSDDQQVSDVDKHLSGLDQATLQCQAYRMSLMILYMPYTAYWSAEA